MSATLLALAVLMAVVAAAVWLGPRALVWLLSAVMALVNRRLNKFQKRRAERHDEIRAALVQLEAAMKARAAGREF